MTGAIYVVIPEATQGSTSWAIEYETGATDR